MSKKKTPQQLLEDLESSDCTVRFDAALNHNATPQVFLKALGDTDWHVRSAAQERIKANPLLQLQISALKANTPS